MNEITNQNNELTDEFMEQTKITVKKVRKRRRNGLTYLQDCFARMCAHYPEELMTGALAAEKYKQIPGIQASETADFRPRAMVLLKNPVIARQIELYRSVLNKDALSLKAEREDLTEKFIETWKERKPQVKTEHILQALKDRETVYGVGSKDSGGAEEALKNERVKEALDIIDIIPKERKDEAK